MKVVYKDNTGEYEHACSTAEEAREIIVRLTKKCAHRDLDARTRELGFTIGAAARFVPFATLSVREN